MNTLMLILISINLGAGALNIINAIEKDHDKPSYIVVALHIIFAIILTTL